MRRHLVTDVVPVALRPKAFSYLYWVVNLGFALAASLGGFATGLGYFALFVIDADDDFLATQAATPAPT